MTLIIGIFIRDIHDKKEILFASDGLAVEYKDNKIIAQYEDVEKIRKLTPKICIGYAGKNSELFEDVFDELNNKTPKKIKKELDPFAKSLQLAILKMLKTKKHKMIEKELMERNQLFHKFIVGGVFNSKLILIRANSDNNYEISPEEVAPAILDINLYVAGSTEEIQKETLVILEKKIKLIRSDDEMEIIIKDTISEIAELYRNALNNHVFIRRLSRNFNS